MAGHVEDIGDDKFGVSAVGAHSESPTHFGDSNDDNVKYQRESQGVCSLAGGLILVSSVHFTQIGINICDVGL